MSLNPMFTGPAHARVRVTWAVDLRGLSPAREFVEALDASTRQGIEAVIAKITTGAIINSRDEFASIAHNGSRAARGLWRIKFEAVRLIGAWMDGQFVIALAIKEKRGFRPYNPRVIGAVRRVLRDHSASVFIKGKVPANISAPDPARIPYAIWRGVLEDPAMTPDPIVIEAQRHR